MIKYQYSIINELGTITTIETLDKNSIPKGVEFEEIEFTPIDFEAIEKEEKRKQEILQSIAQLESQITPRRIREALLGDTSFVDDINKQIEELREQIK